ncbi:VOC family protein, partial [Nocardia salmonicida]|uniref:VOC family protein n=1 Tax=Nocardia salmonicida TaxID=53431 RepID=UPI0033C594E5
GVFRKVRKQLPPGYLRARVQESDEHETPHQRFHLDIHVPHDVAEQRIAAALAAGGTLVSDAEAPSFTVLADADGNRVCVCTWQARESSEEPAEG